MGEQYPYQPLTGDYFGTAESFERENRRLNARRHRLAEGLQKVQTLTTMRCPSPDRASQESRCRGSGRGGNAWEPTEFSDRAELPRPASHLETERALGASAADHPGYEVIQNPQDDVRPPGSLSGP
jgi:hypothetical protein